jgi:hypothetical protein
MAAILADLLIVEVRYMALSGEDRMEILQLLSEGKVSVEEAGRMLAGSKAEKAVTQTPDILSVTEDDLSNPEVYESSEPSPPQKSNGDRPKWFHIRVSDLKTGKGKVTVNIPLGRVRAGVGIGSRFSPELGGMDWDELSTMLTREKGVLIDVQDEEDGEHVQIYVD